MTVLKGVLRGVLSSVTRSILLADDAITRFFTDIAVGGSMSYTIPSVTFTGDYKKTALVYFTGNSIVIDGSSLNSHNQYNITAAGVVRWRAGNVATEVVTASGAVPVNELSLIEVERTGSIGSIRVNGVEVFSGAVNTVTCVTNAIGRRGVTPIFGTGILSNVGYEDNLTPERSYAINENLGAGTSIADSVNGQNGTALNISQSNLFSLQDNGDYLGVELFNTISAIGVGWTQTGARSFSCDGTQVSSSIVRDNTNTLNIGITLRYNFVLANRSAGSVRAFIASNTDGPLESVDGNKVYEITLTSSSGGIGVFADTDFIGDTNDLSIKRLLVAA